MLHLLNKSNLIKLHYKLLFNKFVCLQITQRINSWVDYAFPPLGLQKALLTKPSLLPIAWLARTRAGSARRVYITGQSPPCSSLLCSCDCQDGKPQQAAMGSLELGREVTARRVLRWGSGRGPLHLAAICSMLIRGLPAAAFERNSNVSQAQGNPSSSSARVSLHSQRHMPASHPTFPRQDKEWHMAIVSPTSEMRALF